jgi:lipoate-protein ligase B
MWKTLLLNLKHLRYDRALTIMRELVALKCAEKYPQVLLLVEHEPVVTLGRRSGKDDFKVSESYLLQQGIGIHRVERGGLVTYHGPGQLVAYPIFDLRCMKLGVVQLVSGLEKAIIDTLSDFGIIAESRPNYRGVWVGMEKIASVGIAVRRSISFHGIALNWAPNLKHFDLIHPCGIPNVCMTSMEKLLEKSVNIEKLRQRLSNHMGKEFKLAYESVSLEQIKAAISFP